MGSEANRNAILAGRQYTRNVRAFLNCLSMKEAVTILLQSSSEQFAVRALSNHSMSPQVRKASIATIAVVAVGALAYSVFHKTTGVADAPREKIPAAVAVAPVETRPIDMRRVFSGALEARSKFVVAPKVAGRVQSIQVDISDSVTRGQTVVVLESAEFAQAVNQAEAELAVAEANLAEANSALTIARRENQRTATLRERRIASDAEFDTAQADLLAREAQVKVAEAQVTRAESALESARIRLGYTRVIADWTEGDSQRVVAERYVDEGETVSANDPLLLIVDLNPISAVINVTERDYGLLQPGMPAVFTTDSFPGEEFEGEIARVSPIFQEGSRQARVELSLANADSKLKPGMFVRASIGLKHVESATVIPYSAITRREDGTGVFRVSDDGTTVNWVLVETGIRDGEWIQVLNNPLSGRVVTLGQHLIEDGSTITIPSEQPATASR